MILDLSDSVAAFQGFDDNAHQIRNPSLVTKPQMSRVLFRTRHLKLDQSSVLPF